MCASNDSRVQAIWKTQNSWEKFKDLYKCRGSVKKINARHYTVTKQFTVYLAPTVGVNISQEITMGWETVNLIYAKKSSNRYQESIPRKIY